MRHRASQITCSELYCESRSKNAPAIPIHRLEDCIWLLIIMVIKINESFFRFLVVADSENLYQRFTDLTSEWPSDYKRRVAFEWHTVWYPSDREEMRSMFRVCATERLFLPQMFPSLDAAIYIDTDLIFMRPPEDLWMEFKKFDEIQVVAMAPCLHHYNFRRNKVKGSLLRLTTKKMYYFLIIHQY